MNTGVILIVNAGSSSLKFSLFRQAGANVLTPVVSGQMEGMGTQPRLTARDSTGQRLVEREFSVSEAREPHDAIRLAGAWLSDHFRDYPVIAVGHRVVHGGTHYARPVSSMRWSMQSSNVRFHLRPCTSRTTSQPSAPCGMEAADAASCVFRHRLSPNAYATRRPLCAAVGVLRGRGAPLRFPWFVV